VCIVVGAEHARQHLLNGHGVDYTYSVLTAVQYCATIGQLEPSFVIRRFLDAQRIHNLTSYLEALHTRVRAERGTLCCTNILPRPIPLSPAAHLYASWLCRSARQ